MIPESLDLLRNDYPFSTTIIISFLSILFGIVISMIIDYYVPDTHMVEESSTLFRLGLLSMIVIVLHNVPEGIATFMASSKNINLGISLAIAIALHNIPEGITISVPIYYSTNSKGIAFSYTLISALSEPFGAFLAYLFLKDIMNDFILGIILSVIAGIMLEISLRVLLPSTKKYNSRKRVIFFFMIGFTFMLLKFFL